jgi:hypothetical protein
MLTTRDIVKAMRRARLTKELEQRTTIRRLEELAPIIDRLPDELSHCYDMVFTGTPGDDAQVRQLCAEVRAVLGVNRSDKAIDPFSGTITYITEAHGITVKVYGGDLPANCKLVPKPYIRYEMVCDKEEANR